MNEATAVTTRAGWLERFVEHDRFRSAVLALIVLSAILLGVETSRALPEAVSDFVVLLNRVILYIFVIEIVLRIAVYRLNFFRDSWSLFDFTIVAISLLVPSGPFQVVRSLRILRAFRLVSSVPSLRRVVEGLLGAVPGIASVLFLLVLVMYIAAVMATVLFRDVSPDDFGHLGVSLYSLFQVMTLEGWAEIAGRVMVVYDWAWIYFIGYILVATFLVLNLVIGVVVSSIQSRIESEMAASQAEEDSALRQELTSLRLEISSLRELIERSRS